jgi:hypothetical protein
MSVLALAFLLAACGTGSASAPPASHSAGPTSAADPSTCNLPVCCSLPVYNWGWVTNQNVTSVVGQSGFLSLRSGTFAPDPTGVIVYDDATFRSSTQQAPVLYGDGGVTYDRPYRRWLPVGRAQVLADGSAYVYEQQLWDGSAFEIHLVNVATGADKVIYHTSYLISDGVLSYNYSVLAYAPEGVYLFRQPHASVHPYGLWLLDPATQSLKAVPGAAQGSWQVVLGGGAWGGRGPLERVDFSTGVVTTWFKHAVRASEGPGPGPLAMPIIGFDRSLHPLVEIDPPIDTSVSPARTPAAEIWLVTAPGQATQLTGMPLSNQSLGTGGTDSHGTWLVGADGVYLYTESEFQRVAPLAPPPAPNYTVAGDCV